MFVGSLELDVRLPQCHSLKEKRAVVKTVLQGAARRYSVAASEVEQHDKWQRATFGFAAVSGTESHVREGLDAGGGFGGWFPGGGGGGGSRGGGPRCGGAVCVVVPGGRSGERVAGVDGV